MSKFYKVNVDVTKYNEVIKGKDRNDDLGFNRLFGASGSNSSKSFKERMIIANSAAEIYEKFGEENIKSVENIDGINLDSLNEEKIGAPTNIRDSKNTEEVAEYFRRVNSDRRSQNLIEDVKKMKADLEGEFGKFSKGFTEKANLLSEKQTELFDHLYKRFQDIKGIIGEAPGSSAMNVAIGNDGDIEFPQQYLKKEAMGTRLRTPLDDLAETSDTSLREKLLRTIKGGKSDATEISNKMPTNSTKMPTFGPPHNTGIPIFKGHTLIQDAIKQMHIKESNHTVMMFDKKDEIKSAIIPISYKESFLGKFKGAIPREEEYTEWILKESELRGDWLTKDVIGCFTVTEKPKESKGFQIPEHKKINPCSAKAFKEFPDIATSIDYDGHGLIDGESLTALNYGISDATEKITGGVPGSKLAQEVESMFELEEELEPFAESAKKELKKRLSENSINEDDKN